MNRGKVGIVGAGFVGASTAYTLAILGIAREIVLYDIVADVAIGKAIDIAQATNFSSKSTVVNYAIEPKDMKDCDIVVVTAGVPRKNGMSRSDLLMINAKIVKEITNNIKRYSPNAIIICVSNPLDVMTYLMHSISGLDRNRVIGMAGALDGARMAHYIAQKTKVNSSKIDAMVLGEHGDSMTPYIDASTISGIPITQFIGSSDIENIIEDTQKGGATIVQHLGTSAYYAPARAITAMVEAILDNSRIIISSSVILDGEYGYRDTALGVPVILGKNGVEEIIELDLDKSTKSKLDKSVLSIQENIEILKSNGIFS
ncbi:Malate dehydrogenase [hydrothermal vent metagenome]|uniref:Malate dehydrogenase n=1 Tax=hydrothermal vent metagenome TaxID=652676 RepID=A0A1W1EHE1_9ZZZZ